MKIALSIAIFVSVLAVIVMSQTHRPCASDENCPDKDCTKPNHVNECHSNECHCHEVKECDYAWQCVARCGALATCDNHHCHGDCTHH